MVQQLVNLVILTTHPIQYYAPAFRLLAADPRVNLTVLYSWGESSIKKFDPGFGKMIEWDIPLLDGYDYKLLNNTAKDPGSHHFNGIKNPEILKAIRQTKPDVLLVYGWAYQSHLKAIRHFSGKIPVWFRGDSTLLDEHPFLKNTIKGLFLRWVYSKVDKVLYPGSASKAYFLKYGIKEEQLIFVPHAVDNDHFSKNREVEALAIRKSLNIKETNIVVLFTGKFENKKNPVLLVNAFIQLSKSNTHLILVGDGILHDELNHLVQNNSHVHLLPFVNQADIPVYYQASDLFCLPSAGPGETWGLAVNEAMAAGKAVLVSNKAGCAYDLVSEDQNGMLCYPNKIDNLKARLEYLLSDKDRLNRMGLKSSEIIQNYSFCHQVSEILSNLPIKNV